MLFQASASLFFLGNQSLQSQVSEVLTREAFSHFSLHSPKAARQHKRSQRSNSPRWPLTSVSTMFGWLFTFKHKVNTKDSFNVEMDCCWRQRTSLELLECLHCFFFYIFHPFKCCLWDFYIDVPHLKTILSRFFPVRLIYSHSGQGSTEHKLVNVDQPCEWVIFCRVAQHWYDIITFC